MADITKCDRPDCPIKNTCYRFTARDSQWQSYAIFEECNADNDYEWFMSEDEGAAFSDWF